MGLPRAPRWVNPGAMKVLVTGGGGFLGRYVIDRLLARGYEVASLGRSPQPDLAQRGVRVVQGDLGHAQVVLEAVQGCEAVFHVAARAGVWGPWAAYYQANVVGTRHVVEACQTAGVQRLVYTSTPSVVFNGQPFQGAGESLPYGQHHLCAYSQTKAEAEALALQADEPGGLRVCALRPHLIWGKGDPHLLPRVLAKAQAGRLRRVGQGSNRVDITRVENAADAHIQALDALAEGRAGGKAYFLSQGEPVVLWDWVNQLLEACAIPPVRRGVPLPVAYAMGRLLERVWTVGRLSGEPPMTRFVAVELAKDHWFDISQARKDLGYTPERHPTEAGLQAYAAAWRAGKA